MIPATGSCSGMRYFGERWPSRMLEGAVECELPPGVCQFCGERFEEGDSGWVYCNGPATHTECGVRQALGGVYHQLGLCFCCGGGMDPDPPGLSLRDAARAALKLHVERGVG